MHSNQRPVARALSAKGVALMAALVGVTSLTIGCPGGGNNNVDTGNADVTITREGVDDLRLIHDPELSQVSVTPPVGGVIELTFAYQDPLVTMSVVLNGDAVNESETVSFPVSAPLTADDVLVTLDIDDVEYSSDHPSALGTITFDVLEVDEDSDFADVIVSIDATLTDGTTTIGVAGSVEGRTGERASDDEAIDDLDDDELDE